MVVRWSRYLTLALLFASYLLFGVPTDSVTDHIVKIQASNCSKPDNSRFATGFVVKDRLGIVAPHDLPKDGPPKDTARILTTLHSVAVCGIRVFPAKGGTSYPSRLLYVNPNLDLALVELPSALGHIKPLQLSSSVSSDVEVRVLGCGAPQHSCEDRASRTGPVVLFKEKADPGFQLRGSPALETRFVTVPGLVKHDSGAPIVKAADKSVVGVAVWGSVEKGRGYSFWNYAITSDQFSKGWIAWQDDKTRPENWQPVWESTEGNRYLYSSTMFVEVPLPTSKDRPLRTIDFALVQGESPFMMADSEVSLAYWAEYRLAKEGKTTRPGASDNLPASVTSGEAKEFCSWLRPDARLPSSSEWNDAQGQTRRDSASSLDDAVDDKANIRDKAIPKSAKKKNMPDRSPVVDCRCVNAMGSRSESCPNGGFRDDEKGLASVNVTPRNGIGIRDLVGNSWEWALDGGRPIRIGGSFESHCDSLTIHPPPKESKGKYAGFRCVFPIQTGGANEK